MEWQKEKDDMLAAGFSETEVAEEFNRQRTEMSQGGFSNKEIDDYFGIKEPNMAPTKAYFEANIAKARAENVDAEGKQKKEFGFIDALEAGWQQSVTGLLTHGKQTTRLPDDAGTFYRIASQVTQLAGDAPAMLAGFMGGSAAGSAAGTVTIPIPLVGTVGGAAIGGAAGTFALPAAMRKILVDHYEKGDIKDGADFMERASSTLWEATKAGVTGVATMGTGAAVAKVASPLAGGLISVGTQQAASEIAAMTVVSRAMEGELPKAQDFTDAAILVGGLKLGGKVSSKLRSTYAEKNLKPSEVLAEMAEDPTIHQELVSKNIQSPKGLEKYKDPNYQSAPSQVAAKELPEPVRSEATQKILSKIGEKETPEGVKYTSRDLYKDYVDRLDPINEAIKKLGTDPDSLPINENPYILSRLANDYKAKTKYVMERGTLDFNSLETTGKSLKEIISPFKEDLQSFDAFLTAKRAIEVEGRGLKSGFDLDAAKQVVAEGASKYEKAANEVVQFQNENLKYLKDSGRLSSEAYDQIVSKNNAYVPFKRLLEDTGKGGKKGTSQLKSFKGSEDAIQSPLLTILENTEAIYKTAEKNRAVVKLVELAEKNDGQTLLTKSKSQSTVTEVSGAELSKALKDQGVDVGQTLESFDVFRRKSKNPLAENEFELYRNGKREVWEAADKNVAEALKSLDGDTAAQGMFLKLANGITKVKKFGITFTPDFIAKNLFRDQLTSGVFSKTGSIPFKELFGAMGDIVKKNDNFYNWLKSGGASGSFLELNSKYMEKEVFQLQKETNFMDSAWNVPKKAIDYMAIAGTLAEQATRLAEFKRVTKGETSGAKIFEGGFQSREITLDFQRIGAKTAAMNAITAFQNVAIQGLDKTVRSMKEDPVGVSTKAAAYITTPSVLLWWAQHDEEWYKEIPRWQKDLFWIVKTGDVVWRIPKPQELGLIFGTVPERLLEAYFTDNPRAMKDFNETVSGLLTPSLIPDIGAPVLEQFANKSTFTGAPIVPYSAEKLLPEYQQTTYTSETSKMLGKLVARIPGLRDVGTNDLKLASPLVIENYIRSWTGTNGQYALQLVDKALTMSGVVSPAVKPTMTIADIPFVKSFFVRNPSLNSQSIIDFRDRFEKNEKVWNTVKALGKQGRFDEMQQLVMERSDQIYKLQSLKEGLTNMGQAIQKINQNRTFTADQKRQYIDGLTYMMMSTAREGNKALDQIEEAVRKQKK